MEGENWQHLNPTLKWPIMRKNRSLVNFIQNIYLFECPKNIAPPFLRSDRSYNKCIRTMTLERWRLLILKIENDETITQRRGYDFLTKVLSDVFYVQNAPIGHYWAVFNWPAETLRDGGTTQLLYDVPLKDRGPPISYVYDRLNNRYENARHRGRCGYPDENAYKGIILHPYSPWKETLNKEQRYNIDAYSKETPLKVQRDSQQSYRWLQVCDKLRMEGKPVLGLNINDWQWDGNTHDPGEACYMENMSDADHWWTQGHLMNEEKYENLLGTFESCLDCLDSSVL